LVGAVVAVALMQVVAAQEVLELALGYQ